jgi:hypothetical protein
MKLRVKIEQVFDLFICDFQNLYMRFQPNIWFLTESVYGFPTEFLPLVQRLVSSGCIAGSMSRKQRAEGITWD